jgi:hypothetical protein
LLDGGALLLRFAMTCKHPAKDGRKCNGVPGPGETICHIHRRQLAGGRVKAGSAGPPQCDGCVFYRFESCRINPPVVNDETGVGTWPWVNPDAWCGSHKPIKAAK